MVSLQPWVGHVCPPRVRPPLRPLPALRRTPVRGLHQHSRCAKASARAEWDDGPELAPEDVARSIREATGQQWGSGAPRRADGAPSTPLASSEVRNFAEMMRSGMFSHLYATTDVEGTIRRAVNSGELGSDVLDRIEMLPGTQRLIDFYERSESLAAFHGALRKGVLPRPSEMTWPQEPFRTQFLQALSDMEMPRFCRKHPKLMAPLFDKMVDMVGKFEGKLLEQQSRAEQERQKQERQQQQQAAQGKQKPDNEAQQSDQGGAPGDDTDGDGTAQGGGEPPTLEKLQKMMEELHNRKPSAAGDQEEDDGRKKQKLNVQLESMDGKPTAGDKANEEAAAAMKAMAEELASEILDQFREEWGKMAEAMGEAEEAFDDISELFEGRTGFDLSLSVWKRTEWREVRELREMLENLKELRELVRSLGRGGGRGPIRRAPKEVSKAKLPPGVVHSELCPEETRGLTRSGDLSRMLPAEAALMAAGWPKGSDAHGEGARGNRGARLLHLARRAERTLLSYERSGWLDDEPSRVTDILEMRPAAEMGPIILCLDTSGSMVGGREKIAKALALETLRGAHRQRRQAYLYAFSGPMQVQELELKCDTVSLGPLLDFLSHSFNGGTDVDRPLELSLQRLQDRGWDRADILMVTDGEIPRPSEDLLSKLGVLKVDTGLEVHGLLVGTSVTEPMKELCTHLHVFKSWQVVEAKKRRM